MRIVVLDRIEERHPDVSKKDAADAWSSVVAWMPDLENGDPRRFIGVGFDSKGREVEVVAVKKDIETWVIVHAQTPAKRDIKRRLGLLGGRR